MARKQQDEAPPPELSVVREFIEDFMPVYDRAVTGELASQADLRAAVAEALRLRPAPPRDLRRTAREQANALIDAAWEADEGIALAIEALRLDPECADAWVYTGWDAGEEVALAAIFFSLGMMAAREVLGEARFAEDPPGFWADLDTRPYMRAFEGFASTFYRSGHLAEAAECYEQMLHLNPNDNQGVRNLLLGCYLALEDFEQAQALAERYPLDTSAVFTFGTLLAAFATTGPSPEAEAALRDAHKRHPHMAPFISGARRLPAWRPESFQRGSEEEAVFAADVLLPAWRAHRPARNWLRTVLGVGPRPRAAGRGQK